MNHLSQKKLVLGLTVASVLASSTISMAQELKEVDNHVIPAVSQFEKALQLEKPMIVEKSIVLDKDYTLNKNLKLSDASLTIPTSLTINKDVSLQSANTKERQSINVSGSLINKGELDLRYGYKNKNDGQFYTTIEINSIDEKNPAKFISEPGSTIKMLEHAAIKVSNNATADLQDTTLDYVLFNVSDGAELNISNSIKGKTSIDAHIKTILDGKVKFENVIYNPSLSNGAVEQIGIFTQDYYQHNLDSALKEEIATLITDKTNLQHEEVKDIIDRLVNNKLTTEEYNRFKTIKNKDIENLKGSILFKNSDIKGNPYIEAADKGTITLQSDNNDNEYNIAAINAMRDGKVIIDGGKLHVSGFIGSFQSSNSVLNDEDKTPGQVILQKGTLIAPNLQELFNDKLVKEYVQEVIKEDKSLEAIQNIDKRYKEKVLILTNKGIIETTTNQIFAKAANDTAKDSGAVINKYIDYVAGVLKFNDAKYTTSYLEKAKENLAKEHDNNSKTEIVMTGIKIDNKGNVVKEDTLDETIKNATSTVPVINKLPVVMPDNTTKLVIGTKEAPEESTKDTEGADIKKTALDFTNSKNFESIEINKGKTLTLGGISGDILKLDNKNQKVAINVEGTLQLGNKTLSDNEVVDTHINADVKLKNNSKLTVDTANVTTDGTFTTEGTATVDIINKGTLTLDNTKDKPEDADKVTISKDTTFNVGNNFSSGDLYIREIKLNGAKVLLDPAWNPDGKSLYSSGHIINTTDGIFDGKFVVGRNSVLTLNYDSDDIELTKGENEAALAVYAPIKIDETEGSMVIDPTLVAEDGEHNIKTAATPINTIKFANNTQFFTTAAAINEASKYEVGVLNAGTISLPKNNEDESDEYGSQAYIAGSLVNFANLQRSLAAKKTLYLVKTDNNIENDFKYVNYGFDDLINLTDKISDNKKGIELVLENEDTKSIFNKIKNAYPESNILLANTIDSKLADLVKTATESDKELKFDDSLAFINDTLWYESKDLNGIEELNAMTNLADLGGVTKQSYTDLAKFNDKVSTVTNHQGIWATYTHSNNKNSSLDLNSTEAKYSAKGNGLMIGSNLKTSGKNTLGVAAFYNKTKVTSDNVVTTTNDAKSYGLSLYNTTKLAKGEIVSQLTYSHSSNDLKQHNINDITAKATTSNYSLGAIYQNPIAKTTSIVTPYAGLRFIHLGGAKFTNSLGFNYDVKATNVVEMPFGIRYTSNIKHGNMEIAPYAELGYNALLIGKKHNVTVGLNTGSDTFENSVLGNAWHAKVGANLKAGNNVFGFSYARYQGKNTKDNQFMAEAQFKF